MPENSTALAGLVDGFLSGANVSSAAAGTTTAGCNVANIAAWDMSKVIAMPFLFDFRKLNRQNYASGFNADLSQWDTSSVETMFAIFYNASSFNSDLSRWGVARVVGLSSAFGSATAFNTDLSKWDVAKVGSLESVFWAASAFNGDVSKWDVSRAVNMRGAFKHARSFNAREYL